MRALVVKSMVVSSLAILGIPTSHHAAAEADGAKVILLTMTDACDYCALHHRAFMDTAQERGLDVEVKFTDFDPDVQATQVDQALAERPDAIVLWPAESPAIVPSLRKIHEAGIPLVVTNAKPDDRYAELWDVYTGPNDLLNGQLAAEALIQGFSDRGIGATGKIFVIEGEPGTVGQVERTTGFEEMLGRTAPGIAVVAKQHGDWDQAKAMKAAETLFAEHGTDIQGIYAQADDMLAGAIAAAEQEGIDPLDLVLVGSNCTAEGSDAIIAGIQYASVLQSPIDDGAYAARAIADLLNGEELPNEIFLPHTIVTRANVAICDEAIGR
ncbi:sugar ABC transporter substrate-binding protein [Bauldia sp.]|uniref:sugar ABC transporter substrate-binding protein n=1 Tax=Bauldia sp. TaxID=2575872 RepID=UPI003BAD5478